MDVDIAFVNDTECPPLYTLSLTMFFCILELDKKLIVKQPKNKKFNPLKNIDSVARAQFIKFFLWLFAPLCVLGFLFLGIKGVVITFILSLAITPVVMFVLDKFSGSTSSLIYGGSNGTWSERELLEGDLNMVKYYKMRKEYDHALKAVNHILNKDPEFSEALLIKAQILWEGFKNSAAAKANLNKIMEMKKEEDKSFHRWASNFYNELTEIERNKESDLQSNEI